MLGQTFDAVTIWVNSGKWAAISMAYGKCTKKVAIVLHDTLSTDFLLQTTLPTRRDESKAMMDKEQQEQINRVIDWRKMNTIE